MVNSEHKFKHKRSLSANVMFKPGHIYIFSITLEPIQFK